MAKKSASTASESKKATSSAASQSVASQNDLTAASTSKSNDSFWGVCEKLWKDYEVTATKRTKLIDIFMGFLVVLGVLQFAFCLVFGTFVCVYILMLFLSFFLFLNSIFYWHELFL